jgi:hypothetical protein
MKFLRLKVESCSLPENALLKSYANDKHSYTDCYTTYVSAAVPLPVFVTTFYSTGLFKVERAILGIVASRRSTDAQAKELGMAHIDRFAAWHVEKRTETQLLMCDFSGRTRSWFMVEADHLAQGDRTRLYFGSAVVPTKNKDADKRSLGWVFSTLLGFHKLYSRALLFAAKSRLEARMSE